MSQNNKTNDRKCLLEEISAIEFLLQDLKLYLDTHCHDSRALELYRDNVSHAKELKTRYTAFYGPLNAENYQPEDCWGWTDGPWPWDKQ
ncbi:MAG: spore coat protein CotJB [Clostridia bacterium]|nr:spore coat protein CotJB [Clostridia bacterium]